MTTERGLDRLTYFTDAIAAIAITLLILPLVEGVNEARAENLSPGEYLHENVLGLAAFALSFFVIARLWMGHHSVFEHVRAYTPTLRYLSLIWAFTIVLLPLPTALVAQFTSEPILVFFYIGTMALSSIVLTTISLYVRRHPVLEDPQNPVTATSLRNSILTNVEFVVALALGTLIPWVNYYALLLLFASVPISIVQRAITSRRSKEAHA